MKEVLANGLTLLLDPDPHSQSVAAGFFVATGSRDERADEKGISHFLEHLMFKGSERISGPLLNERLDELGGQANAFTSEEATVYHAAALPEALSELLDTLNELLRPALRETDIVAERTVILEEIAMYAEQPTVQVAEALRRLYWGEHPLASPVLGTEQSVGCLTRDTLRRHYAERYGAERITLVVTGAFAVAEVMAWAQRTLSGWPRCPVAVGDQGGPPQPACLPGHVETLTLPSLTRAQVALACPGLPAGHPLREAATLLGDLIGGDNGALYWALLDIGLADSADFGHVEYRDTGMFEGGCSCDPQRLPEVLSRLRQVLAEADQLITEKAVRRAARKAAVATLLRSETPQGRLFALGLDYLALGTELSAAEAAARFQQVTPAQVREVLRLCSLTAPAVVVLQPGAA